MGLRQLTLESVQNLDLGICAKAFQRELTRAVQDCIDRPTDKRARKITFQFSLTPVKEIIDNQISCEGAKGVIQIRGRLPDYESRPYDFGVKENGMLYFSEESPTNVKQSTMFAPDPREDKPEDD